MGRYGSNPLLGGIRSKYGTIAGSIPALATNRGIGVPLEAKYKPWSLNVNQPLN